MHFFVHQLFYLWVVHLINGDTFLEIILNYFDLNIFEHPVYIGCCMTWMSALAPEIAEVMCAERTTMGAGMHVAAGTKVTEQLLCGDKWLVINPFHHTTFLHKVHVGKDEYKFGASYVEKYIFCLLIITILLLNSHAQTSWFPPPTWPV